MEANERMKTCSRCKKTFSCYSTGCWCSELPQVMPFPGAEDCMCPDCLKKEIDKRMNEVGVQSITPSPIFAPILPE